MTNESPNQGQGGMTPARRRLIELLHKAASKAVQEDDPWAHCHLERIPAERIIRHLYDPHTQTWSTDETICKMEPTPFTHGAMRFCYRLKKRAQPPRSATNHRFHKFGWSRASNYVAKCYQKDGVIDVSPEAKQAIQNDILLQYEAQHWAQKFNDSDPPSKILFLRAYAIEFPDREGQPWFAVERFIAGRDHYGAGFVKHNTNSGFVDTELRRVTPQVFSAHSFYASEGNRLVADIQGVGDLYTDPQVLSSDYRFGDGDLGPRGMALFFETFRHCGMGDALGLPIFPLSKNELKHQAKYDEEEETVSEGVDAKDDDISYMSHDSADDFNSFQKLDLNRMRRRVSLMRPDQQIMGQNSLLQIIHNQQQAAGDTIIPEDTEVDVDIDNASIGTEKRSNLTTRDDIRKSLRKSLRSSVRPVGKLTRTKSDVDEVSQCLMRSRTNWQEDLQRDYHRSKDGTLRERKFKDGENEKENDVENNNNNNTNGSLRHKSSKYGTISPPMKITEQTKLNLGKVHYQLAVLHGMGRFPEIVPDPPFDDKDNNKAQENGAMLLKDLKEKPSHDAFSVLFHLSYAASLQNGPACLALARVHAGLGTHVSDLLDSSLVPLDFEAAKDLLRRAMEASGPSRDKDNENSGGQENALVQAVATGPRVAAGCLLFQILQDERHAAEYSTIDEDDDDDDFDENHKKFTTNLNTNLTDMTVVAEDTLKLFALMEQQQAEAEKVKASLARIGYVAGTGNVLHEGDRVEGDYFMEGSYYPATVVEVTAKEGKDGEPQTMVTVKYDDDGSCETLPREHVRLLIPPTATQTTIGGPLSDEDAFGPSEDQDDEIPIKQYELVAELAELKAEAGDKAVASTLYQEAAERAIKDNKMKTAADWSLKAAGLQE